MSKAMGLGILLLISSLAYAAEFRIDKQKLKLSLEYENFPGVGRSELATSGLKATYLLKGQAQTGRAVWQFDLQTGAKTNLRTQFESGDLSPFFWSNRFVTSVTLPVDKLYVGGSFVLRNKWLANVQDDPFVDLFGGEGFRELGGVVHAGYHLSEGWEIAGSLSKSDVNFFEFPLSNSDSTGGSVRLSKRLRGAKWNLDYRIRSVEYNRPVFDLASPTAGFSLQEDLLQQFGVSVEFASPLFFTGGYFYQNNESNNPGFGYENHRFYFLIAAPLSRQFHLQAYAMLDLQDFFEESLLPFPVLIEETDNNSMAASITRNLSQSTELEFGVQRLHNNSSFPELDVSKYVLYSALNFRF